LRRREEEFECHSTLCQKKMLNYSQLGKEGALLIRPPTYHHHMEEYHLLLIHLKCWSNALVQLQGLNYAQFVAVSAVLSFSLYVSQVCYQMLYQDPSMEIQEEITTVAAERIDSVNIHILH